MKLTNSMKLSLTMIDAITAMEQHGDKLYRWDGGFWTFKDAKVESTIKDSYGEYSVPEWYCDVRTLRALEKRDLVNLDEANKICLLMERRT